MKTKAPFNPAAAPTAVQGAVPALAPAKPDFGNAGSVTYRTNVAVTALHVGNGEYLDYSLKTNAPAPVFGFACEHKTWVTSAGFPAPQGQYSWTHFQKAGEVDSPDDNYSVTVLFIGAPATYTLLVIRRDKTGAAIQTLKDLDLTSSDPTDFTTSTLEVIAI